MTATAMVASIWLAMPVAQAEEASEINAAIQYGIAYLPATIADSQGFFAAAAKEEGLPSLSVKIKHLASSSAMNDALLSGSIDIGWLGTPGLILTWDKTQGNFGVKGLCGLGANEYKLLTTDPAVKTLKDFTPKSRIAVTTTIAPQAYLLRMAAEKTFGPGEDKRFDQQMLSLGHPDAVAALLSGSEVTAYFGTPPFTDYLMKDPRVHLVMTSREIFDGPVPGAGPAATTKFAEKNPKVIRAFVGGLRKAVDFVAANPRRAAELYIESEPQKMSVEEITALLTDPTNEYRIQPNGFMAFAEFMARTGGLKHKPASWRDLFFAPISEGQGS